MLLDPIKVHLPKPGTAEFTSLTVSLSREAEVPFELADKLLTALANRFEGARYEAVYNGTNDRLGNPGYNVIDRTTGSIETTYEGYFAGPDARSYAISLNERES